MKPTAWYDPSNGVVSTDQNCPLFTPLGQVWPLYPKQEDDGVTLPTIRHPRGKPALGDLNPESLETVEIDLPEPIGYVSEGSAERLAAVKQAHEQIRSFRLFAHDVPVYTSPPQRTQQNFSSRGGKRTRDLITIHTCTPPKENT
jgi:hypothetical protein